MALVVYHLQKLPEIVVGLLMDTTFWFVLVENFRKKRNFGKGSHVFPAGNFPMEIVWHRLILRLSHRFQAFHGRFRS